MFLLSLAYSHNAPMAQPKGTHFVVTANETDTGAPVYLSEGGAWSRRLTDALTVDSEQQRDELVEQANSAQRVVCDPYWFSVALADGRIDPLSVREAIRATGPTTPIRRPD